MSLTKGLTFSAKAIATYEVICIPIILLKFLYEILDSSRGCGEWAVFMGVDVKEFDIYYDGENKTILCDKYDTLDNDSLIVKQERFSMFYVICCPFLLLHGLFSLVFLIDTILLIKWTTVFWFICKAICLSVQIYGLVNYHFYLKVIKGAEVYVPAFINLVVTVLAICVVFVAVRLWPQRLDESEGGCIEEYESGSTPSCTCSGEFSESADDYYEPKHKSGLELEEIDLAERYKFLLQKAKKVSCREEFERMDDETQPLLQPSTSRSRF